MRTTALRFAFSICASPAVCSTRLLCCSLVFPCCKSLSSGPMQFSHLPGELELCPAMLSSLPYLLLKSTIAPNSASQSPIEHCQLSTISSKLRGTRKPASARLRLLITLQVTVDVMRAVGWAAGCDLRLVIYTGM
ncbi:hypothetical protein BDZ91DRAFT_204626 [Kalaharituber pfeilii]|nr:hypothetical protein BDZ91DRAFT_204626 [Kalaharituber pfeilii]